MPTTLEEPIATPSSRTRAEGVASVALDVMVAAEGDPACAQCPLRSGEMRCPCRATRVAYAGLGVGCVGLGALGVVVPGLPTTVFLIVAAWLFARSSPTLERRLLRNRLFRPYMCYLDGSAVMPMKARVAAIAMMWVASLTSAAVLAMRGEAGLIIGGVIVACAAIGTRCIWRYRREPQAVPA